jgi:Arc/MetJ family transcription regulator
MSKTLIDIDDELLDRARQMIGPNAPKRDAVNAALSRFVRLHAQREAVDWIAEADPVADLRDPDVKAAARR